MPKAWKAQALKDCVLENLHDLLRYAAFIRQYSRLKPKNRADFFSPPASDDSSDDNDDDDRDRPSLSAKFKAHIEHVIRRELGPNRYADLELAYMKERLRASMLRRWRRTCYSRAHAEKLAAYSETAQEATPVVHDEAGFASSAQSPENPGAVAADEPSRAIPPSTISGATTLESTFSVSKKLDARTNSIKSTSRAGGASLSLPPVPKCEPLGSEYVYDCPYCGRLPVTRTPLDGTTWK
jgi:hypothetical protein